MLKHLSGSIYNTTLVSSHLFYLLFYFLFINNKQTLKLLIFYKRAQPKYLLVKQCQISRSNIAKQSKYMLPRHYFRA